VVSGERWLAGPEAKLDRAIEHLETLEAECGRFLKAQPYAVSAEFEPDAGCYMARFRCRRTVPLRVSVIVGEFVHDLRSALEHVAWVLAASNTDDVGSLWEAGTREKIQFPIAKTSEAFDGHSLIPFITADARAALDGLQPHKRGHRALAERHPLSALHEFWNVDKHRVVSAGLGEINLTNTSFVPRAIDADELLKCIDVKPCEVKGTLEEGAPIAEIRFLGTHVPGTANVDMKGQPTARVLFRAGERATSLSGFGAFCEYVTDVLTAVRPIFPT
jgi:hypothetical protein